MRRRRSTILFLVTAVCLCAGPAAADDTGRAYRPTAFELGIVPRTTYVRVPTPPPVHRPRVMAVEGVTNVIFLNRDGGTYTPGWGDDAIGNVSSIVQWEVDMAPYPYGDESWQQVLECMRALYEPFNVEVTDVDPGNSPHTEVVVSGHPNDIGMGEGVGGVAPMACAEIPNAVSFAFPETYGDYPTGICEAAGQESAHAFGLDHEILCSDIMTYGMCGEKGFRDEDSDCGEFEPRQCACGGTNQNSFQYLRDVLGPARPKSDPPVVTILRPSDGDEVGPGFGVDVEVTDDGRVLRVELRIDGETVGSRFAEPWNLEAPDDVTVGPHDIEVVAIDETDVEGSAALHVEVGEDDGDGRRRSRGCAIGGDEPPAFGVLVLGLALGFIARRRSSR